MTTCEAPVCLIANAQSGRRTGRSAAERAVSRFAASGLHVQLHVAASGDQLGPLAQRALQDGCRTVMVAGGDGSVAAVAAVLAGTSVSMGVLPLGTFNYFARGLGLPVDLDGAIDVCLAGLMREVEVGDVNGHLFLSSASIGLYVAVLKVRRAVYDRWGRSRWAGYWSVLLTMLRARAPAQLRFESGAESFVLRTPLLFVTRSPYQVDTFGLAGRERVAGGELAFFAPLVAGRFSMLRLAPRFLARRLRPDVDLRAVFAREARIDLPKRQVRIALDGERMVMQAPLLFRVRAGALRVLVPLDAGLGPNAHDSAPV